MGSVSIHSSFLRTWHLSKLSEDKSATAFVIQFELIPYVHSHTLPMIKLAYISYSYFARAEDSRCLTFIASRIVVSYLNSHIVNRILMTHSVKISDHLWDSIVLQGIDISFKVRGRCSFFVALARYLTVTG